MALKAIMLKRKIDLKKKELADLRSKDADFEKREAELTQAIGEAITEEEQQTVEAEIENFNQENEEHKDNVQRLSEEIENLEKELEKEEAEQPKPENPTPEEINERGKSIMNETRTKFFGMTHQERDNFIARDDVKQFLAKTRSLAKEKRSVTGAELMVPTVVLDIIRENIETYSKLYKHVRVKHVSGKARQPVMGLIPEGIWTEMVAKLNELDVSFGTVEVDGYKVGGFIVVPNSTLEDSDIALAKELIAALGQAIGLALDKAIVYGTGTKMPLGIITRLVQTADPNEEGNTVPWKDVSKTNVFTITAKTDTALIKAVIENAGAANGRYSNGEMFWAMNSRTHAKYVANSLSVNAAGALVAGVNKEMPVLGGTIEKLEFMPDNVIVGGFGDLYLLVERAGTSVAYSEHSQFIEDNTVFKGTARYDGEPVIAEGFVAMDIGGGTVSATAVTFTEDKANAAEAASVSDEE